MADLGALRAAQSGRAMPLVGVWIADVGMGGNLDAAHLGAYLDGTHPPISTADHDAIVHALNETFMTLGQDHPLSYGTT